ncbi:hypothetical protein SODALDRAFT_323662 [Sodiomyces alkalinus F11]|uniref:DUF676 domain-containing protein n=1 Tax=Sodiomyces alkalinus (strain CBS 110278 / VKM F-3762 / F11) TaxID=1314773 RepID=A0A3N2PXI4_SODAK|nr:hypothetical protein SODALDRAFT_323662 [Sodiomyces alkalinus F11]ROT39240.1 hypothetical protein SODALDRAFT_323662 [Sodiomyces alkalinus F11]
MAPASASSGFTADPRSSSSQSLGSSSFGDHSNTASRRTLLVVYIHGFYGNDQSFRSFPAHVHSHLRNALAHSHVVHTKTYPRYKTYRAIEVARDNFSAWLEPHEGPTTDVILVGHSMGGILAGEVVLSPNRHPYSSHPFRHRILGTVSLDSPFLGLHPGIVASGLASLFHPSPTPSPWSEEAADISPTVSNTAASTPLSTNSPQVSQHSSIVPEYADQASFLSPTSSPSTEPRDPLFNPPFFNDNAFKERPFHKRLARFVKKHSSEGIIGAARNHVLSHLEYGGCLADYPALHSRYNKLRALEDVDDLAAFRDHPNDPSAQNSMPARVRFVNYFTVSTGRPKQPQSGTQSGTPSPTDERRSPVDTILPSPAGQTVDLQRGTLRAEDSEGLPRTSGDGVITPKISLDAPDARESLLILDPMPMDQLSSGDELAYSRNQDEGPLHVSSKADNSPDGRVPANAPQEAAQDSGVLAASLERDLDLPPIPDLPVQPTPPDLDSYVDKEARRQAEKEAKKAQKGYEQAVKHRDKVLRQRQQLLDKHRRRTEKEAARQAKQAAKDRVREEKQLAWEEKKSGPQEEKEHDTGPLSLGGAHVDGASSSVALCDGQATGNRPKGERRDSTHRDADAQEMDPRKPTLSPVKRKPPKERKFCVLPRRVGEGRDETWVRVFMEGVDEVGAHCGLFESGPHYDRLVGDVAQRMVDWVQEDLNLAAVRRLAEEGDGDMVGGEK